MLVSASRGKGTEMNKRLLSILLSLMVMMSMCFAGTIGVFAGDEGTAEVAGESGIAMDAADATAVYSGETLTPIDYSKVKDDDPVYTTASANSSYTVNMFAGTLIVVHNDSSYYNIKVNGKSYDSYSSDSGAYFNYFYVSGENPTLSIPSSGTNFMVYYAPETAKLKASASKKTYYVGRPTDSNAVTKFTITVPKSGYLMLNMGDATGTYSMYYKTKGFKDFEYLTQSDAQRYIGVKKGTYTIQVKSYSPIIGVTYKFVKKSQSSYGTKKAKAKTLKKKKTYKGLIITNSKKSHWYKFKNPKLQKVSIVIDHKLSGGGNGGIKVTVINKSGSKFVDYIYPNQAKYETSIYTVGKNNKLAKGTYWIKIQSYNGGNGYFTVKWK